MFILGWLKHAGYYVENNCTWYRVTTIIVMFEWTDCNVHKCLPEQSVFMCFEHFWNSWTSLLSKYGQFPLFRKGFTKYSEIIYSRPVLTFYKFHLWFWQCHLTSCLVSAKCYRHCLFFVQHGMTVCHYFWDLILLLNPL